MEERSEVLVYDPKVTNEQFFADLDALQTRSEADNRRLVTVLDTPYRAAANAHTIAVLTEWDEFRNLDWNQLFQDMLKPAFVFDGRNVLDSKKLVSLGFHLSSIGKSAGKLSSSN